MTTAVKSVSIQDKLASLQKRSQSNLPITNIDSKKRVHIMYTPSATAPLSDNQPSFNIKKELDIVRRNFKKYTTKAAHRMNSYFILPEKEQEAIDKNFAADEKLQRLAKYLDIALKDFENNVKRFIPNVKNTDYKLDISVGGSDESSVRIGFKNAAGKEIGPFLKTHITTFNEWDYLSVSIGYIKNNKRVDIHTFGYNVLDNVDNMAEKRGNETFLKTDTQMRHDKQVQTTMKNMKSRIKYKHDVRGI